MQEQKHVETKKCKRRHSDTGDRSRWNSKLNATVNQQLATLKMHAPPLLEK
jgi:hypothetical protein